MEVDTWTLDDVEKGDWVRMTSEVMDDMDVGSTRQGIGCIDDLPLKNDDGARRPFGAAARRMKATG